MPLFAFANAGVQIASPDLGGTIAIAIFVGFIVGKPIGVILFSYLAVACRLAAKPADLSWGVLASGGVLTGIGFTMALFIAQMAFPANVLNSAKLSILGGSAVAATSGVLALAWSTSSARGGGNGGVLRPEHKDY